MNEYKYSLDKSSKKFVCPKCGKRRFVRYLNQISNEYLEETFGRCDRETSCGYHNNPKQNECIAIVNIERINLIPDFIDPLLVKQSLKKYGNNNFAKFLHKNFAKDEVENCIAKYNIGTSKHWEGATVFWQINQTQKVHTGKIILFDEDTGKRVKNPFPHINWVHKKIKKDKFNLKQCLFGLHLNKTRVATTLQYHCNTIAIVESEKTAIIMSLFIPEYLWMATGSKQNLKLQLLEPIKNENIVVYPDKGEFNDWNIKVTELQRQGFKIKCSSVVENSDFETGTDLADIYFAMKKNTPKNNIAIVSSDTEKKIQRLSKINPSIISLIETFDLIDEKGNGIFCRIMEY
ncbi:hypothetical protein SAMN05444377_10880 [Flavobacterium fontis]|jgi:hypothetical protein|uniref:Toprim domain-containing protein n=1 Tax=Flavobacterium fontis TaxID=1124188 RepID=A0A1M5BGA6_9FLAO|nr:DUF6371 domain-containing protein [Flavobacterium fontis]SHF41574.1 hypothetical protein SAMN05444377_10880 [Flavobacterium fontis]